MADGVVTHFRDRWREGSPGHFSNYLDGLRRVTYVINDVSMRSAVIPFKAEHEPKPFVLPISAFFFQCSRSPK